MAKATNKKPIEKKTEKEDFTLTPVTEKKETVWKAGRYRYLKEYFGTMGVFECGKEYDFTAEQAAIFGKAGEIEKCL